MDATPTAPDSTKQGVNASLTTANDNFFNMAASSPRPALIIITARAALLQMYNL